MGLNEIRKRFLSFFENKNHIIVPSYSLVPQGDKSLLLINSGMAPMKKFFLGQSKPLSSRIVTCQKCIRTPDIERVGKTSRHGTFFEMLGNFSFGDYFKFEAISWAWEFITKDIKLPLDRLYISIYLDDDEAFEIWNKKIGISSDRIVRLGKSDNFWEIGSGPCGPCSEIYYDRGEEYKCDNPNCFVGCDCDRYVEFWNLVFSQYNSDGNGSYDPMDNPNIDTGMGLERLACIIQGVDNLFEVDTINRIIDNIASKANVKYKENEKIDISLRVIADHIRSVTFMISDGVIPSNESRGYVLRRLIRRACVHGKKIGINEPFLYKIADIVIEENKDTYPELSSKHSYIKGIIEKEEENFTRTIDKGIEILNQLIDKTNNFNNKEKMFSGKNAFLLYDTYGFPIDLTKEILEEEGLNINLKEFESLMEQQKDRARNSRKSLINFGTNSDIDLILPKTATLFEGYENLNVESKIICIIKDNIAVDSITKGDKVTIILDRTSFYAEGGGQVGDIGFIQSNENKLKVLDCKKNSSSVHFHICEVISGQFNVGDNVLCSVDKKYRDDIKKNHTAAHLLHFALREVLGNSVHQAGQYVDNERIRFDFSYFNSLNNDQIKQIETIVNELIIKSTKLNIFETSIDDAHEKGAMALFGEKYGDKVRVVDVAGSSIELCGGTHVDNTIEIGLFKIISENSISSGVRRIEAVTSLQVLNMLDNYIKNLSDCCLEFKISNFSDLKNKCKSLINEMKQKDSIIQKLNDHIAQTQSYYLFKDAEIVSGLKVSYASFNRVDTNTLKAMGDKLKEKDSSVVAILSSVSEGKGTLVAVCGKDAIKAGVDANTIIKEIAALLGGKGGGKKDMAMAGTTNIFKIDEALSQLTSIVQKAIIS